MRNHFLVWLALFLPGVIVAQNPPVGWQEITTTPALTLLPQLEHRVYERTMGTAPYERIRLHRLTLKDKNPRGAVFVVPGMWSSAAALMGEDYQLAVLQSLDTHQSDGRKAFHDSLRTELPSLPQRSAVFSLALAGYDVYSIDFRTHFIDPNQPPSSLAFMGTWGFSMYLNDLQEAVGAAKTIANQPKVTMLGEGFGGLLALNYAARRWSNDLDGLIQLDGGNGGRPTLRIPVEVWRLIQSPLVAGLPDLDFALADGTLTPAVIGQLIDLFGRGALQQAGLYALDASGQYADVDSGLLEAASAFLDTLGIPMGLYPTPHFAQVQAAHNKDPLAAPVDPVTLQPLHPIDTITNRPYPSYLEWAAQAVSQQGLQGLRTNGNANTALSLAGVAATAERYWPLELALESASMYRYELTGANQPLDLLGIHVDPLRLPLAAVVALERFVASLYSPKTQAAMPPALRQLLRSHAPRQALALYLLQTRQKPAAFQAALPTQQQYATIDLPLLNFQSRWGILAWGPYDPGLASGDATNGGVFPNLGHLDVLGGVRAAEQINQPLVDWLNRH